LRLSIGGSFPFGTTQEIITIIFMAVLINFKKVDFGEGANMKNALANSFGEDMKIIGVLSSVGDINSVRQDSKKARSAAWALETAVRKKPKEWIYWHAFSEFCSPLGEHAKAIFAAEECYKLKPTDPRSSYCIATALRMLIMEINAGKPTFNPISIPSNIRGYYTMFQDFDPQGAYKELQKLDLPAEEVFNDPISIFGKEISFDEPYPLEISGKELQELNLVMKKIAKRAIDLFEEAISLGLDEANEKITKQTLLVMHTQFPNL
jgi:hypothetical protein